MIDLNVMSIIVVLLKKNVEKLAFWFVAPCITNALILERVFNEILHEAQILFETYFSSKQFFYFVLLTIDPLQKNICFNISNLTLS
jgi:hypothetical protein